MKWGADHRQRTQGELFEESIDFTEEYPLMHDEGGEVIQTRDRPDRN
jgi:hypothetical protein